MRSARLTIPVGNATKIKNCCDGVRALVSDTFEYFRNFCESSPHGPFQLPVAAQLEMKGYHGAGNRSHGLVFYFPDASRVPDELLGKILCLVKDDRHGYSFTIVDEADDHQGPIIIGSDGDIESARFRVVKPRSPRVRKKKFGYGITAPSMMPAADVLDAARSTMLFQYFDVKPYTTQYYLTGYISLNFLEDPSLVILNRSFRISFVPLE